jgi:hypothetical protein
MQHIDVVGYLTVEAEGDAFEPRRRAPVGRPGAALAGSRVVPRPFTTEFDYRSGPNVAVRLVPQLFTAPFPASSRVAARLLASRRRLETPHGPADTRTITDGMNAQGTIAAARINEPIFGRGAPRTFGVKSITVLAANPR